MKQLFYGTGDKAPNTTAEYLTKHKTELNESMSHIPLFRSPKLQLPLHCSSSSKNRWKDAAVRILEWQWNPVKKDKNYQITHKQTNKNTAEWDFHTAGRSAQWHFRTSSRGESGGTRATGGFPVYVASFAFVLNWKAATKLFLRQKDANRDCLFNCSFECRTVCTNVELKAKR